MFGDVIAQTPPYPIAKPMRFLSWSVKTRRVWNFGAAVRVVEDDDPVAERVHEAVAVHRVVLGDPEPAVRVPGELDGVLDVGLGREDPGLESGRELHLGHRLRGRLGRRARATRARYWC